MKSFELEFFRQMREFAKSNGGKLISKEFLGRTHPYKWRCSERHNFYEVFWELKEQEFFCEKCKNQWGKIT
jgi:hypothetical protein